MPKDDWKSFRFERILFQIIFDICIFLSKMYRKDPFTWDNRDDDVLFSEKIIII